MAKTTFGFLVALALGINTALWLSLKDRPGISAENGPMENFQAVCLGFAFLLWLVGGIASRNRGEKILLIGLALFHLMFLINEVDTRKLDMPLTTKLLHGTIRNIWLSCLWAVMGIFFFKNAKAVWSEFLKWIRTSSGLLMIASGFFWIVSGLNDKGIIGRKNLYYEELMEVNSTPLMLFAAILFLLAKKESPRIQKNELQTESKEQP